MRVYIGTYTRGESKGIYLFDLNQETGALTFSGFATDAAKNPSFLAIHPTGKYLYAVSELGEFQGQKVGGVSAFAIDPATGHLTLLNQQPSGGAGPCHVSCDRTGRVAVVANYSGGTAALLPIRADGSLDAPTDVRQHTGSSVNPKRQARAYAHSANIDPSNRFVFVCDLGIDKVMAYRLDLENLKLAPHDPPFAPINAGAGPRHMAFHTTDHWAWVINELDSTITGFAYDTAQGRLTEIETIGSLPAGWEGTNWPADIHVHPNGRFLYGSNRGHDSLVIASIEEATGKLTVVGHASTRGKNPRNFGLDPSGRWLLAAHQDSGDVHVFSVDAATGQLTPTGQSVAVPFSVCVKFLEA